VGFPRGGSVQPVLGWVSQPDRRQSVKNFLFCNNVSAHASESAWTGDVPSEISESARGMVIGVLYRCILMFFIISFCRKKHSRMPGANEC